MTARAPLVQIAGVVQELGAFSTADYLTSNPPGTYVARVRVTTQPADYNNPGTSTFDGVTLSVGDVILIDTGSGDTLNGAWIFKGSSSPLVRPTWAADNAQLIAGVIVAVKQGTYAQTVWQQTGGTSSYTFTQLGGSGTSIWIGTSAPGSPSLYPLWWKTDEGALKVYYDDGSSQQWVDAGMAGGGYGEGTSFPTTPYDGQKWYRSDLNLLCFYKASAAKWLTVNEYVIPATIHAALAPVSATDTTGGPWVAAVDSSQAGVWVERVMVQTYVSTTNNGSNNWTVQAQSFTLGGTGHNLGASFSTSADTANVWKKHAVTVGAQMTAGDEQFRFSFTKVSAPGNLYIQSAFVYRLIVT